MEIPQGVTVNVSNGLAKVTGPKGEISKKYDFKKLKVEVKDNSVSVTCILKANRREMAARKSVEAHLKNMFKGVQDGFEKQLEIVYAHFPVTLEVKEDVVVIKNFLGEKHPRKARIMPGVKVKASGKSITITGIDKETVGQTANNIAKATKVTNNDIRVFQDGIYYA
ncbi:MAG: 50S ribosomal protein L6 [Candidatus Micrarchaeia archaeon]